MDITYTHWTSNGLLLLLVSQSVRGSGGRSRFRTTVVAADSDFFTWASVCVGKLGMFLEGSGGFSDTSLYKLWLYSHINGNGTSKPLSLDSFTRAPPASVHTHITYIKGWQALAICRFFAHAYLACFCWLTKSWNSQRNGCWGKIPYMYKQYLHICIQVKRGTTTEKQVAFIW